MAVEIIFSVWTLKFVWNSLILISAPIALYHVLPHSLPFFISSSIIFFLRFAAQCQSLERIENEQKLALEKLTSSQTDAIRK